MTPVEAIEDPDWRGWAQRRPQFTSDAPDPPVTHLHSIERWLEDAPRDDVGLTRDDRLTMIEVVRLQLARATLELGRAARIAKRASDRSRSRLEAAKLVAGMAPGGKVIGSLAAALLGSDAAAERLAAAQGLHYRIELQGTLLSERLIG